VKVKSQLVAARVRQFTEQVVTKPVVASAVAESQFEFIPRAVEDVGTIEVLLDQQRNASL